MQVISPFNAGGISPYLYECISKSARKYSSFSSFPLFVFKCDFETHSRISLQLVVERMLASEGIKRVELGRDEFTKRVWEWKEKYTILHDLICLLFILALKFAGKCRINIVISNQAYQENS